MSEPSQRAKDVAKQLSVPPIGIDFFSEGFEEWVSPIIQAALDAERAELEELRIMQLAAISTASIQNTHKTIKDRIGAENPYCSTAYLDVCRAIDREMVLIDKNKAMAALLDRVEHVRYEYKNPEIVGLPKCRPGCPACAWEILRSLNGGPERSPTQQEQEQKQNQGPAQGLDVGLTHGPVGPKPEHQPEQHQDPKQ